MFWRLFFGELLGIGLCVEAVYLITNRNSKDWYYFLMLAFGLFTLTNAIISYFHGQLLALLGG